MEQAEEAGLKAGLLGRALQVRGEPGASLGPFGIQNCPLQEPQDRGPKTENSRG